MSSFKPFLPSLVSASTLVASLALSPLVVAGCGASQPPNATPRPADALIGTWESLSGEVRPTAGGGSLYLRRRFTFERDDSSADFRFYSDSTFKTQTMIFEFGGAYEVLGPSEAVAGATKANFPLSRLRITPTDPGIVGFLNSAPAGTCGESPWKVGVAQDLSSTHGCSLFGIDTRSTIEHDIFKVDNDQLFFGARPSDGSLLDTPEKRPTSWQAPLRRVSDPS